MKYKIEEVEIQKLDIETATELAQKIDKIYKDIFNKRNYPMVNYLNGRVVDGTFYQEFINMFQGSNPTSTHLVLAKKDCCGNDIVGATLCMTGKDMNSHNIDKYGKIVFFWVSPYHRKSTIYKRLRKYVVKWFRDKEVKSVSLNLDSHQKGLIKYFMDNLKAKEVSREIAFSVSDLEDC